MILFSGLESLMTGPWAILRTILATAADYLLYTPPLVGLAVLLCMAVRILL